MTHNVVNIYLHDSINKYSMNASILIFNAVNADIDKNSFLNHP